MARMEQYNEASADDNSSANFSLGNVGLDEYRKALKAMTSGDQFAGKTVRNCSDGSTTKSDKKNCGSLKA